MYRASVAELVDALDSKSSFFGSAGSSPARGTILFALPRFALLERGLSALPRFALLERGLSALPRFALLERGCSSPNFLRQGAPFRFFLATMPAKVIALGWWHRRSAFVARRKVRLIARKEVRQC